MTLRGFAAAHRYKIISVSMVVMVCFFSALAFIVADAVSAREMEGRKLQVGIATCNMALVLGENINSAIQQADVVLRLMKGEWELTGGISPVYGLVLWETLQAGTINQFAVTDAYGNIIFTTVGSATQQNIADWSSFAEHRLEDNGRLCLYSGILGNGVGGATLFMSRRLNGENREFSGIITVGIKQNYLLRLFGELNLGEDHSLSLLHTNGTLLARIPGEYDPVSFMAFFRNHPALALVKNGATAGGYDVPGVDGIARHGSFRLIYDKPVIALATVKREEAFKEVVARKGLYQKGAVAFSCTLALAVLLWWWHLRAQYRAELELRSREKQLLYNIYHDTLTGIFNRKYFYEAIQAAGDETALIMADVDGLKMVNDTFGHQAGDTILRESARIIGECAKPDGIVARLGGDEFAVFFPSITPEAVNGICRRVRQEVGLYNNGEVLPLQLSIGYACAEDNGTTPEALMAEADKWMYKDKLCQVGTHHSHFINTLKEMLVARDFITEGHATRVTEHCVCLAKAANLPRMQLPDLELFAYFHDIGKVGVPDSVLNKPGPLTESERREMENHSEIGHRIASVADDLAPIAKWILEHHERWDGTGYPHGISGEDIPIQCRILAIVDAYDAMTSDRPYRKAMEKEAAIRELERNAGSQFDPTLVKLFIENCLGHSPALRNGKEPDECFAVKPGGTREKFHGMGEVESGSSCQCGSWKKKLNYI